MTVINSGNALYNYTPHLILKSQNDPGGVNLTYLPDEAQKFEVCYDKMVDSYASAIAGYPVVWPDAQLLRDASCTDTNHTAWGYSYYGDDNQFGPQGQFSAVAIEHRHDRPWASGILEANYPPGPSSWNDPPIGETWQRHHKSLRDEIITPPTWHTSPLHFEKDIFQGCVEWKENIPSFSPGASDGDGGTWPDPNYNVYVIGGPFQSCSQCECYTSELFHKDGYAQSLPGQETAYLDFTAGQTDSFGSTFSSDFYLWRQLSISGDFGHPDSMTPCSYILDFGSRARDYPNAPWFIDDDPVSFSFNRNGTSEKSDGSNSNDLGYWIFFWGDLTLNYDGNSVGQVTSFVSPAYSNFAGNSFNIDDTISYGNGSSQYSLSSPSWTINSSPADPPLSDDCYHLADYAAYENNGDYMGSSNYLNCICQISAQLDADDLHNPGAWITFETASDFDSEGTQHSTNLGSVLYNGYAEGVLLWDDNFTNVQGGFYCGDGGNLNGSKLEWEGCPNSDGKSWSFNISVGGFSVDSPAVTSGGDPFSVDHLNIDWESDPSSLTWDSTSLNTASMETTQGMYGMYGTLEYQYLFQDIYFTAKKDSLPGTQGSSLSISVTENTDSDMAYDNGGSNITIELSGNASSYNTDQIMTLLANAGLNSFVVAGGSTGTDFDASASPIVFREGKDLQYQSTTVNCSLKKEW
jgi:hypothetical protein